MLCLLMLLFSVNPAKSQTGSGISAPEIQLNDLSGKSFTLSSMRGKVVFIDFWASWCIPCRTANRSLTRLYREFASKGLEMVSISVDENRDAWIKAVKNDKLVWTQLIDIGEAARSYKVSYLPSSFLIDKKGKLRAADLSGNKLKSLVDILLEE